MNLYQRKILRNGERLLFQSRGFPMDIGDPRLNLPDGIIGVTTDVVRLHVFQKEVRAD